MSEQPRFTALGKFVSILLVAGLVALGVFMIQRGRSSTGETAETATEGSGTPEVSEVKVEVPKLSPAAAVQFKDNIVPMEISEYAGYAGIIAANDVSIDVVGPTSAAGPEEIVERRV